MSWSDYFRPAAWTLFIGIAGLSIAPFIGKILAMLVVIVLILVGMWYAGTQWDLEA